MKEMILLEIFNKRNNSYFNHATLPQHSIPNWFDACLLYGGIHITLLTSPNSGSLLSSFVSWGTYPRPPLTVIRESSHLTNLCPLVFMLIWMLLGDFWHYRSYQGKCLALVEPRVMVGLPFSCSSNPSCTSIWKSPSSLHSSLPWRDQVAKGVGGVADVRLNFGAKRWRGAWQVSSEAPQSLQDKRVSWGESNRGNRRRQFQSMSYT